MGKIINLTANELQKVNTKKEFVDLMKSKELEPLTDKMDMLLLMDFRQENWDLWVAFCSSKGYESEVED